MFNTKQQIYSFVISLTMNDFEISLDKAQTQNSYFIIVLLFLLV